MSQGGTIFKKTKMKFWTKRAVASVLTLVLLLGCMPVTALADGGDDIFAIDGTSTTEVAGSASFIQTFGTLGISSYYSGVLPAGTTQLSAKFVSGGQGLVNFSMSGMISPTGNREFPGSSYADEVYSVALADISLDGHKEQSWYTDMLDPEKNYYGFLAASYSGYLAFILEVGEYRW